MSLENEPRQIFHSDPRILDGTPVFVDTVVPVARLVEWLEGGYSLDEFIEHFRTVRRTQAVAFLSHAAQLALAGSDAKDAEFHSHPGILGGTPVFTGTRVPVETLIEWIDGGYPLDEFLENFSTVDRTQAVAFLRHAAQLALAWPDER